MSNYPNEERAAHGFHKWLLILTLIPLCWLLMMVVHELGHVAAAWLTGGTIERVVLHPLSISRTDLTSNPHPLLVAWGGPIFGALAPLLLVAASLVSRLPTAHIARFFSGFCLIANGCYMAFGSIDGVGDAGTILDLGSPRWLLWSFGAITIPAGLALWHRLGPRFGIGASSQPVSKWASYGLLMALVFVILVELWWQSEGAVGAPSGSLELVVALQAVRDRRFCAGPRPAMLDSRTGPARMRAWRF